MIISSAPIRPLVGNRVNLLEQNLQRIREMAAAEREKNTPAKILTKPKASWQQPKVVYAGSLFECRQKIKGLGEATHKVIV